MDHACHARVSRARGGRTSNAMPDEIAEQGTELSTFNAQRITLNVQSEFSELSVVACKLSVGRFLRLERMPAHACARTNGVAKPRVLACSSTNERRLVLILCYRNRRLVEIRHVNSLR
jgi:hypothetical protein